MASSNVHTDYPGVLSMLFVDNGSTVEAGDRVAEVELMKCMWPVLASETGIITFRIELGEVVAEGDVIAVIETGASE